MAEHDLLGRVLDLLLDAVCVVDRNGRFLYVSHGIEAILGYAPSELIGRPMIDFVHPDDRARTLQAADRIMAGQPHTHFRNRYLRRDGRVADIMWSARWSADDQVRIAVARDVTALRRAEALQAALYAISEAAYVAGDLDALYAQVHGIVGGLLSIGRLVVGLRDGPGGELVFSHVAEHDEGDTAELAEQVCRAVADSGAPMPEPGDTERRRRAAREWLGVPLRAGGALIGALVLHSRVAAPPYDGADAELLQYVSTQIAQAIERKRNELQLRHVALHDALTGLPGRLLLQDRLDNALNRARRNGRPMALLCIDLDGFKQVNDQAGHLVGDRLLVQVAERLRTTVRASDTVARVGGDEFMVVLDEVAGADGVHSLADGLRRSLAQPFTIDGLDYRVTSSIGSAMFPLQGADAEQLIRMADRAMYDAKAGGKNLVRDARPAPLLAVQG